MYQIKQTKKYWTNTKTPYSYALHIHKTKRYTNLSKTV